MGLKDRQFYFDIQKSKFEVHANNSKNILQCNDLKIIVYAITSLNLMKRIVSKTLA